MQSALDRLLFRTLAEAYVQQLTSFGWDDNGNNLIKMYAQPNQNQNVPLIWNFLTVAVGYYNIKEQLKQCDFSTPYQKWRFLSVFISIASRDTCYQHSQFIVAAS